MPTLSSLLSRPSHLGDGIVIGAELYYALRFHHRFRKHPGYWNIIFAFRWWERVALAIEDAGSPRQWMKLHTLATDAGVQIRSLLYPV